MKPSAATKKTPAKSKDPEQDVDSAESPGANPRPAARKGPAGKPVRKPVARKGPPAKPTRPKRARSTDEPDELSESNKAEAAAAVTVFGEVIVASVFSKPWLLRCDALDGKPKPPSARARQHDASL